MYLAWEQSWWTALNLNFVAAGWDDVIHTQAHTQQAPRQSHWKLWGGMETVCLARTEKCTHLEPFWYGCHVS